MILPVVKILVIDIGGSHVKLLATGRRTPIKVPSGPNLTAARMVEEVLEATEDWSFDAVSIGYPGPRRAQPTREGAGQPRRRVGALQLPARIRRARAHDQRCGHAGARQLRRPHDAVPGPRHRTRHDARVQWRRRSPGDGPPAVRQREELRGHDRRGGAETLGQAQVATAACTRSSTCSPRRPTRTTSCWAGGNVRFMDELPPNTRRGSNANAFRGGFRLWDDEATQKKRAKR